MRLKIMRYVADADRFLLDACAVLRAIYNDSKVLGCLDGLSYLIQDSMAQQADGSFHFAVQETCN